MQLSARNQFAGTVKSITHGAVVSEVVLKAGELEIVAVISKASAEALKLAPGSSAIAIVKSTEVMIGTP